MPTFRHGKGVRVFFDGAELSTMLKDVTINNATDTAETTAFMSAAKTFVLGNGGTTVSATGMFSYSNVAGATDIDNMLQSAMAMETPYAITIAPDGGVTAGKVLKGGQALETSVQTTGSVSDLVGISADFQVTDAFFNGLSLRDPDSLLALTGVASVGTGQDYTVEATHLTPSVQMKNGGICVLHVLTNTVNAATTLKIQHSTLIGGTYVDMATFTIPATTKAGYTAIIAPAAIDKFIRYNITATGTGNLGFLCYFAPRSAIVPIV